MTLYMPSVMCFKQKGIIRFPHFLRNLPMKVYLSSVNSSIIDGYLLVVSNSILMKGRVSEKQIHSRPPSFSLSSSLPPLSLSSISLMRVIAVRGRRCSSFDEVRLPSPSSFDALVAGWYLKKRIKFYLNSFNYQIC